MGRSWAPFVFSGALAVCGVVAVASMSPRSAGASTESHSFERDARPILQARCQPCHFSGGKIYDRLPFDREDVVRRLGTARLFTRLKGEKDRAVLRAFLGEKTR